MIVKLGRSTPRLGHTPLPTLLVHASAPKETSTSSLRRILFLLNLKHGYLVPNYLPMKLLAGLHLFVCGNTDSGKQLV
jgi:hypothetical protein